MPRPVLICLLLCLLLLLPTWADTADETPLGACYMGYGKMLEAAKSRQLSLNAHVQQFLYQPGGLGIAYQGSQKDSDTVTQFIRLVGVKKGTTTNLVSTTSHTSSDADQVGTDEAPISLGGWSGDGQYLLLEQDHFVTQPDGSSDRSENFLCANVGVIPPRVTSLPLPEMDPTDTQIALHLCLYWWSPNRTRLLFTMQARFTGEDRSVHSLYVKVYDPKTGSVLDVTYAENQAVRGWLDDSHLLLDDSPQLIRSVPSTKTHYAAYDIVTGTQTTIPTPKKMPALPSELNATPSSFSPKAAYMKLDDEAHHIVDEQKVGAVDAHALWVRRTQGPKLMSAAPVGLTPGMDDPQAVWSPNGAQIAFIAHGDLFVTDLTIRDATAIEKYAAGEKLTCPEERDLAANNLKQVGLGLLQYCQDNDERFPPGKQWQDGVLPYLKAASLFNPAGHPVVYRVPPGMTLASIDAPAETVLGYVDLPCATVTLYADGHVKSIPKAANGP